MPTLKRAKEARQVALQGFTIKAANILRIANGITFKEARAHVMSWLPQPEPKPITVTVPVTFTVLMAPGWTHGHLVMTLAGGDVREGDKRIGFYGVDPAANPAVHWHKPGTPEGAGDVIASARGLKIFQAVTEALAGITLPKENPMPRKG